MAVQKHQLKTKKKTKASTLQCSAFYMDQLSHLYMTTGKTIALAIGTFVSKVMFLLFITLSRFVIAFRPRSKCLLIYICTCLYVYKYVMHANHTHADMLRESSHTGRSHSVPPSPQVLAVLLLSLPEAEQQPWIPRQPQPSHKPCPLTASALRAPSQETRV